MELYRLLAFSLAILISAVSAWGGVTPCCNEAPSSYNQLQETSRGIDNAVIPKTVKCAKEFVTDPTLINDCIQKGLKGFVQVAFYDLLSFLKKGAIETSRFTVSAIPGGTHILRALNIQTHQEVWEKFLERNGPKAEVAAKFLYRIHTDNAYALEVSQKISMALSSYLALASRQYLSSNCSEISKAVCSAVGKASPAALLSIGFALLTTSGSAAEAVQVVQQLSRESKEVGDLLRSLRIPVPALGFGQAGLNSRVISFRVTPGGDRFYRFLHTDNIGPEVGEIGDAAKTAPKLLEKFGIRVLPSEKGLITEHPDLATANRIADRLAQSGDPDAPVLRFAGTKGESSHQEFLRNWGQKKATMSSAPDPKGNGTNVYIFHDHNIHGLAYRLLRDDVINPSAARARFFDDLTQNPILRNNRAFRIKIEEWQEQLAKEIDLVTAYIPSPGHLSKEEIISNFAFLGRAEGYFKKQLNIWRMNEDLTPEQMTELIRIIDTPSTPDLTRAGAQKAYEEILGRLK